jgi:hypothetical protein
VWRRQVGLVRVTRWPTESSAGRMVARTARQSRGWFLGWASKPRSSWDNVGAESWVVIGGGYTEFMGFVVVHQKTTGLLSWATKRGRRLDEEVWPPRPVQPPRRGGQTAWASLTTQGAVWPPGSQSSRTFEVEDMHQDRKACVEDKQGCSRWASVWWWQSEDFQIHPWGECIPVDGVFWCT